MENAECRMVLPSLCPGSPIPKAVTARRQTVDWSGLPCDARFWDWKLGPAKAHYQWGPADLGEPHI
jgi:hypothetical protein